MIRSLAIAASCIFAISCGAAKTHAPVVATDDAHQTHVDPAVEAAMAQAFGATAKALDESDHRAIGWRGLPPEADWRTILDPDRRPVGSFSSGTPTGGRLSNSVELELDGEFHSIIDRLRKFENRWGTHELVHLIQQGGRYVHAAEGGAPLRVGDMSHKKGGDIRWHRSHNSGRDVDLAFYVVEADTGESVPAPRLLHFDGKGIPRSRKDLRFDVARNWRLVEGLLTQDETIVQWLFISRPLKKLLLEHARKIDADPEIVRRAESVLHQPKGASPHANHFHLRIACSADDRVDGCIDSGPKWDWEEWHRDELLARALATAETFSQPDRRPKLRALKFLAKAQSPFVADVAAVWGFWDADAKVREAAVGVVHAESSWSANVLIQVSRLLDSGETTASQRTRLRAVLRRSGDEIARMPPKQVGPDV